MSRARPAATGQALELAQAAIVAASFVAFLAGSNAAYPLLPVYRDTLGLDPFVLSLTFTLYVAVLVPVLFVLARPRFTRHATLFLLVGLGLMIPSDLMLANAGEASILIGRVLAGIGGGLGTGAASALVVAAIGARGRGVTATGNTVGAILGVSGSQLVVVLFAASAPQAVFLGHAAVVGALLIAASVVLRIRRAANQVALASVPGVLVSAHIDRPVLRMFVTGAIAWICISVTAVFGAPIFNELGMPLVQVVGPILLVCGSMAGQLASPAMARIAPWVNGMPAIAVGITGVLIGGWLRADVLAVTGFAVLGAGIGIAYRAALVALTRGAAPARQGALASLYAAVTYAVAALVVLLVGWIGNTTGLVPAAAAALVVSGMLAIVASAWAPRLRDTIDISRSDTHRRR